MWKPLLQVTYIIIYRNGLKGEPSLYESNRITHGTCYVQISSFTDIVTIHKKLFKRYKNNNSMEDKTKISLLYTLIGGLLGLCSAFLTVFGVPNTVIAALYIGVVYVTTYLYSVVGVKLERLGDSRPRSALNGIIPSLLPWLVIWTMIFYLISPVIFLAGPSDNEAAEDLKAYLESQGMSVRVTDDYSRYIFAHKVVVFGSWESIPLGTNYGISAFHDAVQRLLTLEAGKDTVFIEKIDTGELITLKKTGRLIIIISGQKDAIEQIAQENQEKLYNVLK
jgi:hypothetical protein